jgi:hypothetical protein
LRPPVPGSVLDSVFRRPEKFAFLIPSPILSAIFRKGWGKIFCPEPYFLHSRQNSVPPLSAAPAVNFPSALNFTSSIPFFLPFFAQHIDNESGIASRLRST